MRRIHFGFVLIIVLVISGCHVGIIDSPEPGMRFNADVWADKSENGVPLKDPDNFYLYVGKDEKGSVYKKNPRWSNDSFSGGILVSNGTVVRVLSTGEINAFVERQSTKQAKEARIAELRKKREFDRIQQQQLQKKIDDENARQERLRELKSRTYSTKPANFTVQISRSSAYVISVDESPFLLERVVINNRYNVKLCDFKYTNYMQMGDKSYVTLFRDCGDSIVRIDAYTNRGSLSFSFDP